MDLRDLVDEALALGMSVATHSPKSDAANEVRRLFDEVVHVAA